MSSTLLYCWGVYIRIKQSSQGLHTRYSFYPPLLDEYLRNRLDVFADYCSALDIEAREFKPILGGDYHLSFWLKTVCLFCMYIQYGLPESINRYLLQDMPRYNLTTLRLYTGTLAYSVPSPVRYSQARTYSQL